MDDDAPDEEELIDPEDLEGLSEDLGGIETDDPDILEVDELDEPDFDDELVDDLVDDELVDDELVDDELVDEDIEAPAVETARVAGDEDDDEDDDDEVDPDDVEASLDVILKDRLVIEEVEDDDDDAVDTDDRGEGSGAVVPKRPDEFVCQSCFLVKHPSQLADAAKMLCRDCV